MDVSLAVARTGADVVYLNTALAGPQVVAVLAQERPALLVRDREFSDLLGGPDETPRVLGWVEELDDEQDAVRGLHRRR